MNRIGYGPKEVAAFRAEVAAQVVPMLKDMMAMRAERTGIAHPDVLGRRARLCRRQPDAARQL